MRSILQTIFGCRHREVEAAKLMAVTEKEHAIATEEMDKKINDAERAATAAQSLLKRLSEDMPR